VSRLTDVGNRLIHQENLNRLAQRTRKKVIARVHLTALPPRANLFIYENSLTRILGPRLDGG